MWLAGAVCVAAIANILAAQGPSPSARLAASLSTITTDTGPLAPGRTAFPRYSAPGLCVASARNVRDLLRRTADVRAQTLLDSLVMLEEPHPMRAATGSADDSAPPAVSRAHLDTLPPPAIAVARTCGAHFTATGVPTSELNDLFELALLQQNDALAHAVLERHLAAASSPAARDTVFEWTTSAYLAAEPARFAAADTVVARMEASIAGSLDHRAQVARLRANDGLLAFAVSGFDRALMRRIAEHMIVLGRGTDTEDAYARARSVARAYRALMQIAASDRSGALPELARRAKQDLGMLPADPLFWPLDFGKATEDAIVARLLERSPVAVAEFGKTIDSLAAPYQYATPGAANTRAALSVYVIPAYFNAGGDRLYAQLRHWNALYGSRLSITVVTATTGSWALDRPGSGPQTAEAEAQDFRFFYQDYLHLPVRVAVFATPFHRRSDGVRVDEPVPFLEKYGAGNITNSSTVVLIDAQRRLLYLGAITPYFQATLADALSPPHP